MKNSKQQTVWKSQNQCWRLLIKQTKTIQLALRRKTIKPKVFKHDGSLLTLNNQVPNFANQRSWPMVLAKKRSPSKLAVPRNRKLTRLTRELVLLFKIVIPSASTYTRMEKIYCYSLKNLRKNQLIYQWLLQMKKLNQNGFRVQRLAKTSQSEQYRQKMAIHQRNRWLSQQITTQRPKVQNRVKIIKK